MISEKKIFLDRNDDIRVVVDRLINAPTKKVILNIPKDSELGRSLNNFQILKRESATAGKELVIESVDDHILELAGLAKLEATNPVFRVKERVVADILPRYTFDRKKFPVALKITDREPVSAPPKKIPQKKEERSFFASAPLKTSLRTSAPVRAEHVSPRKKRSFFGWVITISVLISIGVAVFFLATEILPRAAVDLTLKKTNVDFRENVEFSSKFTDVDLTNPQKIFLPGELLVASKNLEMTFDAHGKEKIETRARGKLIVYNAYSSEAQSIVKGTRFVSPEGKVFRLDAALTIPAAKIENGKIVPSQVEASVTADEVGPDYNVPASKNWRIPGFAGTPKYQGFYAEAAQPMTGGFIGERPKPTEEDLRLAREKMERILKDALTSQVSILLSDELKSLEGTSLFKVLDERVETNPQTPEKFIIWREAEMRYFVFKEKMLRNAITQRAKRNLEPNLRVVKLTLNYENPVADLEKERLTFLAVGSIQFESDIDFEGLRKNLLGVDEKTLRVRIFTLPGLERATISLWPFWVKRVPLRLEKVKITAN
jgi:hypothetical protein